MYFYDRPSANRLISDSLDGVVASKQCLHNYVFFHIDNGGSYRFGATPVAHNDHADMCDFIQQDDSVWKLANNDTIHIVRAGRTYSWLIR